MRKHMFGLIAAVAVMAISAAVVAADRLAEPAEVFAVNPAVTRVTVGETDRASGMADYFVVRELAANVPGAVKIGFRVAVTEIPGESPDYFVIEFPAELDLAIQKQIERVGETDMAAGLGPELLSLTTLRRKLEATISFS
ncbi:MAG: hypothetical protein HY682_01460 [Chloroflexi bacterium]|nr:hypothetical protein [Chloroflexota bacterium]